MKFSADRGSDLNDFLKYIVLDTIGGDDEIWKLGNMAIMERIEFISICVKVWILVFRFIEYMFGTVFLSLKSNVI